MDVSEQKIKEDGLNATEETKREDLPQKRDEMNDDYDETEYYDENYDEDEDEDEEYDEDEYYDMKDDFTLNMSSKLLNSLPFFSFWRPHRYSFPPTFSFHLYNMHACTCLYRCEHRARGVVQPQKAARKHGRLGRSCQPCNKRASFGSTDTAHLAKAAEHWRDNSDPRLHEHGKGGKCIFGISTRRKFLCN